MAFNEDLTIFFADFGVVAIYNGESAKVIFDMPDIINNIGDQMISADYTVLFNSTNFTGIKYADQITVNGVNYTVNDVLKVGDGKLSQLGLSKV